MMEICLGNLSVTSVRDNAGVFWGKNTMTGWTATRKANSVLYRVNGDGNRISSLGNYLADPDFVDVANVTQAATPEGQGLREG